MDSNLIFALAVFALVSSITPGPNNLMLLASGINFGFVRTIPHALGVGLGFMFMILLVGLGLMQVFDAWPTSYLILKIVSVSYLLYLAWKIATAAPPETGSGDQSNRKPFTFLQAAAFQWVNPKAWSMALTAISVYTPPDHPLWSIIVVSLVFGALNLPSVSLWVIMGSQLRRFLQDPAKLRAFNMLAAALLVATLIPILS